MAAVAGLEDEHGYGTHEGGNDDGEGLFHVDLIEYTRKGGQWVQQHCDLFF